MAERIHVVLDRLEKQRFRQAAERDGKTLSEWLRDAARAHADRIEAAERLDSAEALDRFFAACDRRESGLEADWDAHLGVIRRSVERGEAGA